MNATDLLLLNFEEVRRRSLVVWNSVPPTKWDWRPDPDALSYAETVRHVLESGYHYHCIIQHRGTPPSLSSPFEGRVWNGLEEELAFNAPYRKSFMQMVQALPEQELSTVEIIRPERNQRRRLGDYLLRAAYHEGVHCGQLLSYLRQMDEPRPNVWD